MDVGEARDEIYQSFVRLRRHTDLQGVQSRDIKRMVNQYDRMFFGDQLAEQLTREHTILDYSIAMRDTTPATNIISTIDVGRPPSHNRVYILEIAPKVISQIALRYNLDAVRTLQLMVEHELIHLLMKLWKYENKIPSQADIYGPHGKLFQCMLETYFGYISSRTLHDLGVSIVSKEPQEDIGVPPALLEEIPGYKWYQESCYIDSLLVLLFYIHSGYWREKLFKTDVSTIDYREAPPCDIDSDIDTPEKVRSLAARVQTQLKSDYTNLPQQISAMTCTLSRSLLAQCQPAMRPEGKWDIYNITAIYDLLANLYDMKLSIPIEIQYYDQTAKSHISGGAIEMKKLSAIGFIDYLTDSKNPTGNYPLIKWNLVMSPVLVFQNSGVPLHKLNEAGEEEVDGESVTKIRAFGETILEDRYRLTGVAMLLNDNHYVSYFRARNGEWYSYNDLGGRARKIEQIPKAVWSSEPHSLPEMYFYERMPQYEITVHPPPPRIQKKAASQVKSVLTGQSYAGQRLDYKTQLRDDGYVFVAVMAKSPEVRAMLDELAPLTKPSADSRIWRIPSSSADDFLATLRRLDATGKLGSKSPKRVSVVKSPSQPEQILPGLFARNYGENSFALYGQVVRSDIHYLRQIAAMFKGEESKNLGSGLGPGFVFPLDVKSKVIKNIQSES